MKIIVETDNNLTEPEIVIRVPEGDERALEIQQSILRAARQKQRLRVMDGDTEAYILPAEILFMETDGVQVAIHTRDNIYRSKYRLYELSELLPPEFIRISKSAIVNSGQIRTIKRNLTGASEISFSGTAKLVYVSRSYYKSLIEQMEERMLRSGGEK